MTSETENSTDPYSVERHFGHLAPASSGGGGNAAASRASAAADAMWQKVEDDLEKMDRAEIDEDDND